jgi:hypothetical protein
MENSYSFYYGLIFSCPMGSESEECDYRLLRKLPIKERLAVMDVLTEKERQALIDKHRKCLLVREKRYLPLESQ